MTQKEFKNKCWVRIEHPGKQRAQRFDIVPTLFILTHEDRGDLERYGFELAAEDEESWYTKFSTDMSYWPE